MASELDMLWSLFRRIDKSRDGNISVKELAQARRRGDLQVSASEAKALMGFSDEDENGHKLLSFPAFFVACTGAQLGAHITPSLLKAFTGLDVNDDGYVDRKDLLKAAEVCPPRARSRARRGREPPPKTHARERAAADARRPC